MKVSKNVVLPLAVTAATFVGVAGASLVSSLGVSAATSSTTSTTSTTPSTSSTTAPTQMDPTKGGHTANGITETLLTGDTATKAKAAAVAAEPGATVERAETDAEGATYEVHMTKADGSQVTIKLDASFNVTATEAGGPGGRGAPSTSTTTN